MVQVAEPLTVAAAGATGPAGPLPNGLRREVLGFLPYWKLDTTTRASLRLDLRLHDRVLQRRRAVERLPGPRPAATPTVGWSGWTSSAMTELINAAHARGVRVVPTITMMAWNGDYTAMSSLLNSCVVSVSTRFRGRRTWSATAGPTASTSTSSRCPSSLRAQFTSLVRQIKAGLRNARVGSYVTVDTMAGAATWSTGYDVAGLTATGAADALMVMAYDFHYAGSSRAGGVAPMESDHIFAAGDALRAHLADVAPGKLIWGIPYYGRAWNTTSDGLNCDRSLARPERCLQLLLERRRHAGRRQGPRSALRSPSGTPPARFPGSRSATRGGGWRQGYYDDPASLRVKYNAVLRQRRRRHRDLAPRAWTPACRTCGTSSRTSSARCRSACAGADRYATAAAVSRSIVRCRRPGRLRRHGHVIPRCARRRARRRRGRGGPMLLTTRNRAAGSDRRPSWRACARRGS